MNISITIIAVILSISFLVSAGDSFFKEIEGIKYWCNENVLICTGEETDDEITGNNNSNILYGWTGSDYLRGMEGDDIIFGGEGSDTLIGDVSNDVFDEKSKGKDVLIGGLNDDILVGYKGNDYLYGGEGDDWIRDFAPIGSNDTNNFFGEEGNDLLVGGLGRDTFSCGNGVDVVVNMNKTQGDVSASDCELLIDEIINNNPNSRELLQFMPMDNGTINFGRR